MNEIRRHPKETSLFLECVHTFNRIAAGIHDKTLDEVIIFQTWPPRWFERQWEILEDLIRREEEEQRELKESYRYFRMACYQEMSRSSRQVSRICERRLNRGTPGQCFAVESSHCKTMSPAGVVSYRSCPVVFLWS